MAVKEIPSDKPPLAGVVRALQHKYSETAKQWLHKGEDLYEQGRYKEAAEALIKSAEFKPGSLAALYRLGRSFEQMGRFEDAVKAYDKAIARNNVPLAHRDLFSQSEIDNMAQVYCKRGNALYNLGEFKDAVESYARAISLKEDYAEAWHRQGNAIYAIAGSAEPSKKFERLKKDAARSSEAIDRDISSLLIQMKGKIDGFGLGVALNCYDKALALEEHDAHRAYILEDKGYALSAHGKLNEALDCFKEAKKLGNKTKQAE